jgi:hypothetical protein
VLPEDEQRPSMLDVTGKDEQEEENFPSVSVSVGLFVSLFLYLVLSPPLSSTLPIVPTNLYP